MTVEDEKKTTSESQTTTINKENINWSVGSLIHKNNSNKHVNEFWMNVCQAL